MSQPQPAASVLISGASVRLAPPVLALTLAALLTAPQVAAAAPPVCAGQPATIVGTSGDDDVFGTPGDDVVWLGPGDDRYDSSGGHDLVCLGSGRDQADVSGTGTVHGGPGEDTVGAWGPSITFHGEDGDDYFVRQFDTNGADRLYGGAGDDFFDVTPGVVRLHVGTGLTTCASSAIRRRSRWTWAVVPGPRTA